MTRLYEEFTPRRNRILPSVYSRVRGYWMTARGSRKSVRAMDSGHLHNSMQLLKESHGNLQSKVHQLLGRLEQHYRNCPNVLASIKCLYDDVNSVDVDELYPIFTTLAHELECREDFDDFEVDSDNVARLVRPTLDFGRFRIRVESDAEEDFRDLYDWD